MSKCKKYAVKPYKTGKKRNSDTATGRQKATTSPARKRTRGK